MCQQIKKEKINFGLFILGKGLNNGIGKKRRCKKPLGPLEKIEILRMIYGALSSCSPCTEKEVKSHYEQAITLVTGDENE